VRDPLRDLALAVQALDYAQKIEVAVGLRTSVARLGMFIASPSPKPLREVALSLPSATLCIHDLPTRQSS
jgi:hypothetical protein